METSYTQLPVHGEQPAYTPASHSTRFLNCLIDCIIGFIITYAILYFIFMPGSYEEFEASLDRNFLMEWGISIIVYFSYYFFMEAACKGRTLGKFFTGTKAISQTGNHLTAREALFRTLVRLIPIEAFSFFGKTPTGWHDRWTKTAVAEVRKQP